MILLDLLIYVTYFISAGALVIVVINRIGAPMASDVATYMKCFAVLAVCGLVLIVGHTARNHVERTDYAHHGVSCTSAEQ